MTQRTGPGMPQPESPEPAASVLHGVAPLRGELRLQVPAIPAQVAGIRRAVLQLAEAHAIACEQRNDIALAVSEACTNVVVHAYRGAVEPGLLTIEIHREPGEFTVVVSDTGVGMAPRSDSPGLGMGLALIARLAQRVEVAPNGSTGAMVTMVFVVPDAA